MNLHCFTKVPLEFTLVRVGLLMLLTTPYAGSCSCPTSPGWSEKYNARCYYISSANAPGGVPVESVLNYSDARKRCQSLGGDLVSVNSAAELGFMRGLLSSSVSSTENHWIGARRTSTIPTYIWEDGSEVTGDWVPHITTLPVNSLDLAMYATTGSWYEAGRLTALHYVCERDECASPPQITTAKTTTRPSSTIGTDQVILSSTPTSVTKPTNTGSYDCMSCLASYQNSYQSDSSMFKGVGIGVGATIGIELLIIVPVIIFILIRRRTTPTKECLSVEAAPPVYVNSNVTMATSASKTKHNTDGAVYADIEQQGEAPEQEHAYQVLQT